MIWTIAWEFLVGFVKLVLWTFLPPPFNRRFDAPPAKPKRCVHEWDPWSPVAHEKVIYTFLNPQQRVSVIEYQTRRCRLCNLMERREVDS